MWYCVHALLYYKFCDGDQTDYIVWEHLYLVEASSPREAHEKGKLRAIKDEPCDSDTTIDGRAALLTFAGIKKVVECQDLDLGSGLPVDGTELSYSEFLVSGTNEFNNLLNDIPAAVVYTDR